jgi:hypothetical protein
MGSFKQKRLVFMLVAVLGILVGSSRLALAVCPAGAQSCSNTYQVDQTFFGSGGNLDACSSQFCSKQTLGELGVGATSSANFRAYAGFNTTDAPYIELYVTAVSRDLGVLDTDKASITTGQFYVRAWQASGYGVQTASDPPANGSGGHQIAPMTAGGTSQPGTEQFGINLVKNAGFVSAQCPLGCDTGDDPLQVPDNTFAFGFVEPGYDTDGTFKYNKGDFVARSAQSTSRTVYTVSYLFNISDTTPSGQYTFNHFLVATGTY